VAQSKAEIAAETARAVPRISVGVSGCSVCVGAEDTLRIIHAQLAQQNLDAIVEVVGCRGVDYAEPLVDVQHPGGPRIAYGQITPDLVPDFFESVVVRRDLRPDLALFVVGDERVGGIPAERDFPYFKLQHRVLLANCGLHDPLILDQYVASGGFAALYRALTSISSEQVIEMVKASGLTGRGGSTIPTG